MGWLRPAELMVFTPNKSQVLGGLTLATGWWSDGTSNIWAEYWAAQLVITKVRVGVGRQILMSTQFLSVQAGLRSEIRIQCYCSSSVLSEPW